MSLSDWAIRNIRPIVFLTAVLSMAGAFVYSTFPVAILPDVSFPRVVIVANVGSRPTQTIETAVTKPLEDALVTLPGIKRIQSKTKPGSTEVSVDFVDGTDVILAEQLVNAKVNEVRPDLPIETQTEVERMNPTVFPVAGLTVKSKSLSQTELWNLATYVIRPRLARAEGVARADVQGGRPPEILVEIKTAALGASGLSTTDVVQAIQANNAVQSVGRIDREFKQYQVVVNSERHSALEFADIVVGQKGGVPIKLSDVAEIKESTQERLNIISANGAESVLINVIRQPSANSAAMVEAVSKELKHIKGLLPSDVEIGFYYDQSVLVKEAIASVRDAVLIGAVLSVVVLMLFLRNVRATLVTAAIIPITLMITFLFMRLAGLSLNLMTLGALAVGIGLIIDDAIVVVEAVFRNLHKDKSVAHAVGQASKTIAAPMISSTITTVVVFLPLAFLKGMAGAFFMALALTLTMALLVSLGLALCVSPSLCSAFLKYRDGLHDDGRTFSAFQGGYEKLLQVLLRAKWLVVPIILGTLGLTWFLFTRLDQGFMPDLDEGAFVLDYWSPPGTSLDESDRLLHKVDAILQETPEIDTFSRRTASELGVVFTETHRGDYAIMLKTNRKRDIFKVMDEIKHKIEDEVPGLDVETSQVLQDLLGDLAGNPEPVEVKLFGEDKEEVEKLADQLSDQISKIKGISEVKTTAKPSGPQIQFVPNDVQIGRHGLTSDQVVSQLSSTMNGVVATQILMGDRQIPVRVRIPAKQRSTLEDLQSLLIQTNSGPVQLRDLGEIKLNSGTTQSWREDQRRYVAVTGQLEGLDVGHAAEKVDQVLKDFKTPPGVSVVVAGLYASTKGTFAELSLVLVTSIVLVFTVMVFQFRRFEAPVVVLMLMPLAMLGSAAALYLTHTKLNVSSYMGIIMLAGIVVKNGILLLDQAQKMVESGQAVEEAVLAAGRVRMRPILMTTLTAVLGLLPLALGIGAGAEMQKPLAVAVVGGLIFSTAITLLVGPVLYSLAMKVNLKSLRK